MHKGIVVLIGLLSAAPFLNAAESSSSRFYLTPSVEYMFMGSGPELNAVAGYPYRDLKFKDTAGLSLEAGFLLTPKHALKFETGYYKTETETPNYLVPSLYGPTSADLEIVPLLVGYKYIHKINDKWQLLIGVSEGVTLLQTATTLRFLGDPYNAPRNLTRTSINYAFTFGGDVGVEYNLNERSKLTLGVKCRSINSTGETTRGVTTSVNAGYKFSF